MFDTYATFVAPTSVAPVAPADDSALLPSTRDDVPTLIAALEQTAPGRARAELLRRIADARHLRACALGAAPTTSARYERAIFQAGTEAIPAVGVLLDHPRRRIRRAAARILAHHGEPAIGTLIEALNRPLARAAARDALATIGLPAAEPLAHMLRAKPADRNTKAAADAAFSAIAGVATRRELNRMRRAAVAPLVIGAILGACAVLYCVTAQAELGFALAVIFAATYIGWALVVVHDDHYYDVHHHYGWWYDLFTAPFQYRTQLRNLASRAAERVGFERRHRL